MTLLYTIHEKTNVQKLNIGGCEGLGRGEEGMAMRVSLLVHMQRYLTLLMYRISATHCHSGNRSEEPIEAHHSTILIYYESTRISKQKLRERKTCDAIYELYKMY